MYGSEASEDLFSTNAVGEYAGNNCVSLHVGPEDVVALLGQKMWWRRLQLLVVFKELMGMCPICVSVFEVLISRPSTARFSHKSCDFLLY